MAYVTSRTPGPGTYELGWQRPVFLFPSREPGTTIGGPLANVDRVQTGPLGAAYRSDTPGPGAYSETDDRGFRAVPTRTRSGKGYHSAAGSTSCWSGTEASRANTRGFVSLSSFAAQFTKYNVEREHAQHDNAPFQRCIMSMRLLHDTPVCTPTFSSHICFCNPHFPRTLPWRNRCRSDTPATGLKAATLQACGELGVEAARGVLGPGQEPRTP